MKRRQLLIGSAAILGSGLAVACAPGQPPSAAPAVASAGAAASAATSIETTCASPTPSALQADIVDSHAHLIAAFGADQVVKQMDAAGVSVVNLYPLGPNADQASQAAIAQYPGRFVTFVATPDNGPPWQQRGKPFVSYVDSQLATGKFMGIGETNLRFYRQPAPGATPQPGRTPSIYTPATDELWMSLVDLAIKYKVPTSFHFIPDDATANAAFDTMLAHAASIPMIWAHLGMIDMPLDLGVLAAYLLRYPNLYFDTAALQNIMGPPYQTWFALTDQSSGLMKDDAKRFFETWNDRVMLASDAGGGDNGKDRWLNYDGGEQVPGNPPNSMGRYRKAFSNVEPNAARNILGANAKTLLLKKPRAAYDFSVPAGGACQPVRVSSSAAVSRFAFDAKAKSMSMTVASSTGTSATLSVAVPAALGSSAFAATVDGAKVALKEQTPGPGGVTVGLDLPGGIRTVVIGPS